MDDQREVIAFLSDGASHGAPGVAVEGIETHISYVFLIGERAYKLKRAVRFSYLDYSTLALREKLTRLELALNRRTAAALYLGVRKITRAADARLAFGGAGEALDWVLEMRRFSQDDLFDRLAKAGKLTPELMRDLTDVIVAFHDAAEITAERGGRQAMEDVIAGNHCNLLQSSPPLDRAPIQHLHDASRAALDEVGALLDARRRQGRVRRCHGDLHLRNICLYEGRPTPFDCIEFNDEISCVDVLYDLAFLLMDLVERRLTALAAVVFNRYLDLTGDIGGLPALPLLMSVRSAIRSHVLAAQGRVAATPQTLAPAREYLTLAVRLLRPCAPRLVAIGGLSGVGKSTLAQALAADFPPAPGARVIRSDVLRKRLFGVAPETKLPASAYDAATNERVYGALDEEAAASLGAGYTAIVDAVFLRAPERQRIAALARDCGVPFAGLWLQAPADLLAARLTTRRSDASDADLRVLEQQLGFDLGTIDWHRLDAGPDLAVTVAAARSLLAPPLD